jgi:very-short-patch-repair endonuclease
VKRGGGFPSQYYICLMYFIPYETDLKEFSRSLRNNSTLGEVLLWQELRAGKLMGYKFNRQRPIDRYIVDFYCKPLNLVIEVDGHIHSEEGIIVKDEQRQKILEELGIHFLRFDDNVVRGHISQVIDDIEKWIIANKEIPRPR